MIKYILSLVSEHEDTARVLDFASLGVVVATIADFLPATAAVLTIIWTAIRIFETQTVQRWISRK